MPFTFRHAQLWARSSHCERGGQEEAAGSGIVECSNEEIDKQEERDNDE